MESRSVYLSGNGLACCDLSVLKMIAVLFVSQDMICGFHHLTDNPEVLAKVREEHVVCTMVIHRHFQPACLWSSMPSSPPVSLCHLSGLHSPSMPKQMSLSQSCIPYPSGKTYLVLGHSRTVLEHPRALRALRVLRVLRVSQVTLRQTPSRSNLWEHLRVPPEYIWITLKAHSKIYVLLLDCLRITGITQNHSDYFIINEIYL